MSTFTPVTEPQHPATTDIESDEGATMVVDAGPWRGVVRWASAVGMAALTGVALGFTCNAAGMGMIGPQSTLMRMAPFAIGTLYGVAGGLSLVDWASEQTRRAYVFAGGLAFAAPMIGLGVLRMLELSYSPEAVFRGGVSTLLEVGGAVALTQVGDVMRSARLRRDEQFRKAELATVNKPISIP